MMDLGRYREYIKGEKRGTPPSTSKQHTPTKYKNIYIWRTKLQDQGSTSHNGSMSLLFGEQCYHWITILQQSPLHRRPHATIKLCIEDDSHNLRRQWSTSKIQPSMPFEGRNPQGWRTRDRRARRSRAEVMVPQPDI